jgi:hypothetical protein
MDKFRKFIEDCNKVAKSTDFRARWYMGANNTINIAIILGGCVIGFTSISTANTPLLSAAMGFGISLVKGFQDMFKFAAKSILLKSSSLKLKKLARLAEMAIDFPDAEAGQSDEYLLELYRRKEAIEMEVFRAMIISNEIEVPKTSTMSTKYSPERASDNSSSSARAIEPLPMFLPVPNNCHAIGRSRTPMPIKSSDTTL